MHLSSLHQTGLVPYWHPSDDIDAGAYLAGTWSRGVRRGGWVRAGGQLWPWAPEMGPRPVLGANVQCASSPPSSSRFRAAPDPTPF